MRIPSGFAAIGGAAIGCCERRAQAGLRTTRWHAAVALQAEAANEPLHVEHVCMSEAAAASITQAWQRRCGRRPLYPSADDFLELVQQVLARDIRSVHQRLKGPSPASLAVAAAARTGSSAAAAGGTQAPAGAAGQGDAAGGGFYHVVLDGVDIAYDVDGAGNVLVSGGTPTARHETS